MPRLSGPIVTDHLRIFTHDEPQPPTNAIRTFGRNVAHLQKGDICICRGGGLFVAVDVEDKADVIWFGFVPMDTAVVDHNDMPAESRTQTIHDPIPSTIPTDFLIDEFTPGMTRGVLEQLQERGIKTIADLRNTSDDDLLDINGIGPRRLKEIRGL